jgi:hypothetical protein
MGRFIAVVVGAFLLSVPVSCPSLAQDSKLKPGLDLTVLPIVKGHSYEIKAGGPNNLAETLQGKLGQQWNAVAPIYDYESSQVLRSGCTGYVSSAPNLRFHYGARILPDIRVAMVASATPMTLVVRAPNGQFYCSVTELLPGALVWFYGPPKGVYDVWIATSGPNEIQSASITLLTTDARPQRRSRS